MSHQFNLFPKAVEHPTIQVTPPEEEGDSSESEGDDKSDDQKVGESIEDVKVRFCATAEKRQTLLLQRKEELLQQARRY